MSDPLESWRTAFLGALTARGPRRRRIVAEIDDHLACARDDPPHDGEDPAEAALRRLGDPELLAASLHTPRRPWRTAVAFWLPAALAATICAATVEVAVQQDLRSTANDPQIQIAHDVAVHLAAGAQPSAVLTPGAAVDIAGSLAVSVTVLDDRHDTLASNARLDGAAPHPPDGALDAARPTRPNMVTWQPTAGVRQAAVIEEWAGPTGHGTIVVARSLREVEQRESDLLLLVIVGWLAALGAAAAAALLATTLWHHGNPPPPTVPATI